MNDLITNVVDIALTSVALFYAWMFGGVLFNRYVDRKLNG